MEDEEEKPKRTRSVTSAADRLPSTASTAEARASAAVPPPKVGEKGWKSGQIVGDFEGFYSKNCRDDQEISRFWWNWIGNMWIYHDLSGNMCYLRWLTTKLGWGAGAQTLGIPGGSFIDVDDVGVWRAKDTGRVGQILLRSPGNKEANLALLYVNGI